MAVPDPPLPLSEHLRELRRRLIIILIAIVGGFLLSYPYADTLYRILLYPLLLALSEPGKMVFTRLTEPFMVYLKTSLLAGVLLAMPVIFLEIWLFIRPAFRGSEERYATSFVVAGSILFVVGALFGYFVVFPAGFKVLLNLGGKDFVPMISIEEYFDLVVKLLLAFGLIFETPLLFYFLGRLGIVTPEWMRKSRRFVIVAIFIIAAILTPPDAFSQVMMAIPLLVLYEVSIWIVALWGKSTKEDKE